MELPRPSFPWALPVLAVALLACWPQGTAAAPPLEQRLTLAQQSQVSLTIYHDDLALVRDERRANLVPGANRLAFAEVSARMQPETARLRALDAGPELEVLEQNFEFDQLSPAALLERYLGQTLRLVREEPRAGEPREVEAQVLAVTNGVVLQIGDGIETNPPGHLVFPALPAGLRDRPTLAMRLDAHGAGARSLELSYLTRGLSWRTDFVAQLNPSGDRLDLAAWVSLTNQSGASFPAARLQLVAGTVHQAQPEGRPQPLLLRAQAAETVPMAEEGLAEYHLYTLARVTDLQDRQTKQVALFATSGLPFTREYLLEGSEPYYFSPFPDLGGQRPVAAFLTFDNPAAAGGGQPLPRGIVRVYQQDSAGISQLVGEDRIDHTATNRPVRLRLGEAFDLSARRTQTDFRRLAGSDRSQALLESAFRIELANAKAEAVTVKVREPLPGEWEILKENRPHTKESAGAAVWRVEVPAAGRATLEYRVRLRQ